MTDLSEKLTKVWYNMAVNTNNNQPFSELFKKYRLKAELATLSELGMVLAEKGIVYDDSIFSHWQKGTRIPSNRALLLTLLEIFIERNSITSIEEANKFLAAAGFGYVTDEEADKISLGNKTSYQFHIPGEIANFTGREEIVRTVSEQIRHERITLLYGPPGVGKSALAVTVGYTVKRLFTHGVLWYRLDTSSIMDILLSIAYAFGEDIGHIKDVEIRASTVRSLLYAKKILLILDNVNHADPLRLLIPNAPDCRVIVTSREKTLSIENSYVSIQVPPFTNNEVLELFQKINGKAYLEKNKLSILTLGEKINNLPLALNIYAKQIHTSTISIETLLKKLQEDTGLLQQLSYEDKNLFMAIDESYKILGTQTKKLFTSLVIFMGEDFSLESIAFLHSYKIKKTDEIVEELVQKSLVETSIKNRYRLQPTIKVFLQSIFRTPLLYAKAASYYITFLRKVGSKTKCNT